MLRVAAAYGRDPAAADRAAEILLLLDVYPDLEQARQRLAGVRSRPAWTGVGATGAGTGGPPVPDRDTIVQYARLASVPLRAQRLARLAGRYARGTGLLAAGLLTHAGVHRTLRRVEGHYRFPATTA